MTRRSPSAGRPQRQPDPNDGVTGPRVDVGGKIALALELHRRLWGSVLVTERDAGNHGVAWGTNKCVNGHLEAYLLEAAGAVALERCGAILDERARRLHAHSQSMMADARGSPRGPVDARASDPSSGVSCR